MSKAIARDPIYLCRRFQPEIIELCVPWYLTYRWMLWLPATSVQLTLVVGRIEMAQ